LKQVRVKYPAVLLIGLIAAAVAHAEGNLLGGCQIRSGHLIPSRPSVTIPDIAAATFDRSGAPVIYFNPYAITLLPRKFQDFIYAHECAHHVLGHLQTGLVVDAAQEAEADCWAIAELTARGSLTRGDVAIIASALPTLVPGDGAHPPGTLRGQDIRLCISPPALPTASAKVIETDTD
jgi:hypothetical protein